MLKYLIASLLSITASFALESEKVTLAPRPAVSLTLKTTSETMKDSVTVAKQKFVTLLAAQKLNPDGFMLASYLISAEGEYEVVFYQPVKEPQTTQTPLGNYIIYRHKGAYDLIDQTYEEIADDMDEKKLTAQDRVMEEYITDFSNENAIVVVIYLQAQ